MDNGLPVGTYTLTRGSSVKFNSALAVLSQIEGAVVRVKTSLGTYRIHVIATRLYSCPLGSTWCGSSNSPNYSVESDIPAIGASLESSASADYTYQAPYVPYSAAALSGTGTATGAITIQIPSQGGTSMVMTITAAQ
jgi:hypothetical protein